MRFLNGEPLSHTFALIKPDAVLANKATDILDDMGKLFVVADVHMAQWRPREVEAFYSDLKDKIFFPKLVEFMSSAPMFAVTLVAPNAVELWREQIGPTDPLVADSKAPQSFRARYSAMDGVIMHNAVHGSDSVARAALEVSMVPIRVAPRFGEGLAWALDRYTGAKWSTEAQRVVLRGE